MTRSLVPFGTRFPSLFDDFRREMDGLMSRFGIDQALACSAVGAPDTVATWMRAFVEQLDPDELILTANVHDAAARRYSFELAMRALSSGR